MSAKDWSHSRKMIVLIHEARENPAVIGRIDSDEYISKLKAIAAIHDELSKLAARYGEKVGESHVDSQ